MDAATPSTTTSGRPPRPEPPRRRLLGGYAPLAVALVALAVVIAVVPSTAPPEVEAADVDAGTEGQPATGWGDTVEACPGGGPQVEGDPYSPPCFTFRGDNGGATAKGVSEDGITVTYRQTPEPNVLSVLAGLMGIEFNETPEDFRRTTEGLVDYFNANFEMYGRRMVFESFEGNGSLVTELVGGGQEDAANDGLQAGVEHAAFADITAVTQPYAEALAREETIGFGAPYMSREWFTSRRPYAWSIATDCSVVAEAASAYSIDRLLDRPAIFAEGALKDRPRKIAVIAPNNPEYQRCAEAGLDILADAGKEIDFVTDYVLDLGRIPNQAKSISAQIVSRDITTISCFCDPFMVLSLAQEIESQNLQPEWIATGTGFVDLDLIGQGLANQTDQWDRAFGVSPLAEQLPQGESAGYRAYKSVRDDEPSLAVDVLYYQLYQLALGIQMAGPELTPETFETGLFSFPAASGPAGTWDYFPESYTPITDLREIWWDPDLVSPFNGDAGSYASNNERFSLDELPSGQPEVFGR
ncbi:MAG TPA: hypothetical protein VEW93_09530 [Acidimicrobiales bacterium]|nr:hypothetical protein [Acidimicrobiales bacterium]